jgi:SagB-type dehydrogenase family enzyme
MFDRERVQALFARREDADVRDLLLPSELYHENTKTRRGVLDMLRRGAQDPVAGATLRRAEARQRRLYDLVQFGAKSYPHVPRITLPPGPGLLGCDIADAIRRRVSDRHLSGKVGLPAVAAMLRLGYGVTRYADQASTRLPRRAVPSGGALYPLEVYALAAATEGLEPGVYHFDVFSQALERLPSEDVTARIRRCFLDDDIASRAAVTIVVTTVLQRLRHKYGELAYRLALLEAGHLGQNVCLIATGLGLGVCPLAGYVDDALNDLLSVDGVDETVVYALAVGARKA